MDAHTVRLSGCGIIDRDEGEGYTRQLHHHPDTTEVLFIADGEGSITIGETGYPIAPPAIVIYNQGIWHEEALSRHRCMRMLYFNCTGIRLPGLPAGFLLAPQAPCVYMMTAEQYVWIEQLFIDMHRCKAGQDPTAHAVANHLLAAILAIMASITSDGLPGKPDRSAQAAEHAKHYMEERYGEKLTLEQLSAQCFLSAYHLSRTFKAIYGFSPMKYLSNYRIEAAKHFLRMTQDTVDVIAARVGYDSGTHFQNIFKRTVGFTPGAYRKKIRSGL